MKINKLKKSALKNDKIFLGSYHKKNKNQDLFFISFLLYHAKAIKLKSDKALKILMIKPILN
jgi:hypothetical protein